MKRYWLTVMLLGGFFAVLAVSVTQLSVVEDVRETEGTRAIGDQISLALYRNPDTRPSVVEFFVGLAGDRGVAEAILQACDEEHVSPLLAFAIAQKESRFRPNAIGSNPGSRDVGLFQLNSKVYPTLTLREAFDPLVNSRMGLRHLRLSLQQGYDLESALAIYNAGPSRVWANQVPRATQRYVADVMENYERFERDFFRAIASVALVANNSFGPKNGKRFEAMSGSL